MPFEIIRNDITQMRVDAIVNSANPQPVIGAGTDSAIHEKAGPALLEARQKIGPLAVGEAAVTPGFRLAAKYVIHTVGPVWNGGGSGEEALLRRCYESSLALALEMGCRSVAFPLISAGTYGFPRDKALQTAISAFSAFLTEHEMQISLVVFDRNSFRLSEKLFRHVASYIDENYVAACENLADDAQIRRRREAMLESAILRPAASQETMAYSPSNAAPSLAEKLKATDAGFSETLLGLITRSGKKDSEIYTRANVSRQHFSKIRNNPDYRPTKSTAIAFAIALGLDLEQTRDLIGRAGYALTNSSKFDVIIMYFIEQKNYDMYEINSALFEFDQSLLGGSL